MRRAVLVAAAALLVIEALVFALIGLVMGLAVRRQQMSVGGLSTDAMAVGAWAGQGLLALFLLICAGAAARAGLRVGTGPKGAAGRGAARARALLVICAVLQGLLGAVLLGLSGVPVFAAMMLMLAMVVLAVLALGEPRAAAEAHSAPVDAPPQEGGPAPA
jgi:hypothetical protein